ncbi:glutathione synthase [Spartinivicinus poritis]|uniref:Glutathione synthetase n=1 Tax=Spartinivicinus poritis TaxID=2994640 RepID=A0ABT5UAA6_9GAMM|nr:glutathione synthase [Spartinivicinus sp. A2-2]MDE1463313.1 glutathione synthase [Spartinivicinus sp. A2-2]
MNISLGIVMDPISQINYHKDSSLAMLLAAQAKGWQLFYMEQRDLYQKNGVAKGLMQELSVQANPNNWFALGKAHDKPLAELNVILMRKDPPFDNEYIYSTYLLEQAEQHGTLVVNKPQSLRDCNEKFFATHFPDLMPASLISRRADKLKAFASEYKEVIYKPLDGMGGSSVFKVKHPDPNTNVILETLTNFGQQQIMAQQFVPDIKTGDKRILMIDGEPVPYSLARIPPEGEIRGNLAAGGSGVAQPLSERDKQIATTIGPVLKEKGLIFVGLDVIGNYLTEINVTSPTCIREIDNAYNLNIAGQLMDTIYQKIKGAS